MFFNNSAFRITAFIFIITTSLLALIQPPLFFSNDGRIKAFSFNYTDETTPVTFGLFIYTFLVLLYIFIIFIDARIVDLLINNVTLKTK